MLSVLKGKNKMSDMSKKHYSVSETFEMTKSQIAEIIAQNARRSLAIINKAYEDRKITYTDYEKLVIYYSDPDKVYRHTYRAIYNLFKQPEDTHAIDLSTGKVEQDRHGSPIAYSLKAVTPFTNTKLVYYDKFHNEIGIIFPEMKDAERAIEKLCYEYGKEYNQDLYNISDIIFRGEDRESFADKMQDIPLPSSKLHDILRLTVTCKYKTDTERLCSVFQKNRTLYTKDTKEYEKSGKSFVQTSSQEEKRIKENEPYFTIYEEMRNRFDGKLEDNSKMYYDIKIVLHIPDEHGVIRDVEIQFKVQTLYYADARTHKLYEDVRNIEKTFEKEGPNIDKTKKAQMEAKKKILLNRITQINKNAIHQYNMTVVDKIRRIEDDGYIPIGAEPEHTDGTYQWCREFLFKEYMPESLKDFDAKEAFNPDSELNKMCFLRMIGKLEPDFDEFSASAPIEIEEAFSELTHSEMSRFKGIYQVSSRYGQIIQNAITNKRIKDNGFSPMDTYLLSNQFER